MANDAIESKKDSIQLTSAEILKNFVVAARNPELLARNFTSIVSHPDFMARSLALLVSHPGLMTAVRKIEIRGIVVLPGILPGLPPLPPVETLKLGGGEVAASLAAHQVGRLIYDRLLKKNRDKVNRLEIAPNPSTFNKKAIAKSFLEEIEEMEREATAMRT